MMNIVYAVVVLAVLGCAFGLALAIASKVFEVETDPRMDMVLGCLSGANCGGCGYPGCSACAQAIVEGKAPVNACPSCSGENTAKIAAIMGVEVASAERMVAFVRCSGGNRATKKFDKYSGIHDCVAAMKVAGNGNLDCAFGCLGEGSCVAACKFDAIHINDNGVAEVDREKCTNCGMCIAACPRKVITSVPYAADVLVPCANKDKGAVARKVCSVSCIGCMLCQKNCEAGAITVKDNIASIDYSKCTSCGVCVSKCPRKLIINISDDGRVAPVVVKE